MHVTFFYKMCKIAKNSNFGGYFREKILILENDIFDTLKYGGFAPSKLCIPLKFHLTLVQKLDATNAALCLFLVKVNTAYM